jgi:uncharacterized membrane protein YfcA
MEYVAFGIFALVAALAQAWFGFGYGILLTPAAAAISDPETAIAASILTGSAISIVLYAEHQPRSPLRETSLIAVAGVAGIPFGIWLLTEANDDLLRLFVGFAVLASALAGLVHGNVGQPRRPDRRLMLVGAGLLSGAMRGAVSMPGPPVLLYAHWRGGTAEAVRGTMFGFNGFLAVPGVVIAAIAGVLTTDALTFSAAAVPGLIVGLLLGRALRSQLGDRNFARASLALLATAAALGIATAAVAIA